MLIILLALSLGACAQSPRQMFTQPDGHWWLSASPYQRDGFDLGQSECDNFLLHRAGPSISSLAFENAITNFYSSHPQDIAKPVTTAITEIEAEWKRAGAYRFAYANQANDYPGEAWRQLDRDGIIRGFLACQVAAGVPIRPATVVALVNRVDAWYGISREKPWLIDPKRAKDKLCPVILRAEKEPPRR